MQLCTKAWALPALQVPHSQAPPCSEAWGVVRYACSASCWWFQFQLCRGSFLPYLSLLTLPSSELDISSFAVENEEEFFEHHLRKLSVSLSGTPPAETSAAHRVPHPLQPSSSQTTSARLTQTQSGPSPPKALQTLSPSHTPHSGSHTQQTPTSLVVHSRIVALPDTPVGHCAGKLAARIHLNSIFLPTHPLLLQSSSSRSTTPSPTHCNGTSTLLQLRLSET